MKKAIIALALILSGFIYAQELGSEVSVSKNWISNVDVDNGVLRLSNGSITNHLNKSTRALSLNLYFSKAALEEDTSLANGILVAKNPVSSLRKNSSISGISLQNSIQTEIPDGIYYQILTLTDKDDNLLDINQLRSQINVQKGIIQTYKAPAEKETKTADMSGVTDLNKPFKLAVSNDNSITLEKDWKIDVDYKNFMINLTGGDIANNKTEQTGNIILDVFLTKDNQTSLTTNFDGMQIATAPMNSIEASKKLVGAKIKTNLRAIPPQGTYYLLLTISKLDASGKQVVVNSRTFENPITL